VLLADKTAIVYGGSGAIGSAVARTYASEGARVWLAGRTASTLEHVADAITAAGGRADVSVLDVSDPNAVTEQAAHVAKTAGRIDIAFNAVSNDDVQGAPLSATTYDDFLRPVTKAVTAHFHVANAVGAHMSARGSGVILAMGGGREAIPRLGGAHVAWAALAGLCRQLACELGPTGIRVLWLLSPGSPETDPNQDEDDDGEAEDPYAASTMIGRRPTLDDVANVAAFLSSDQARTMTATEVNLTGGAVID
jgi:NAD(P)-dependent dehydrogenase (short-subunit alcohol dehydrogenase family)